MTHFPVAVIVSRETPPDDLEQEVERLLAPYDENMPDPETGDEGMFRRGSRWDWWTIGGRWSGWFGNEANVEIVEKLPAEVLSTIATIVTPDGEWHEAGRAGWFGMVIPDETGKEPEDPNDPTTQWAAKRAEILSGHRSHIAVLVDCHV